MDGKTVEILQMSGTQDPDEYIREHGKASFLQYAQQATRLSEFFVRELVRQTNPTSAEGRAKLVHEAKPLLQKISAPVLRVQLTKEIADKAGLSQAEVESQCGLKPLSRFWAPVRSQKRTVEVSKLRTLLKAVLERPERAARLPLDSIPADHPAGAALHAIADAINCGVLTGNHGILLEFLRGSPHEAIISTLAEAVASDADATDTALEFEETLESIRAQELKFEIAVLTKKERDGGLSSAERQRLAELLARKSGGSPSN
jgi:DNA primase